MSLLAPEDAAESATRPAVALAATKTAMPVAVPPRLIRAPLAVVAPVPPSLMPIGVAMPAVAAFTKSVPFE